MLDFSDQIKSFEKNDLVFSLYIFLYYFFEDIFGNKLFATLRELEGIIWKITLEKFEF
jgi:hypothetical protein